MGLFGGLARNLLSGLYSPLVCRDWRQKRRSHESQGNVLLLISKFSNRVAARYARHGDTRTEAKWAQSRSCSGKFYLLPKDGHERCLMYIDSEAREWLEVVTR